MALITNSNKVGFVYVPVGKNLPGTLTEGRIYFNANTSEILINDGVATRVFGVDPTVFNEYLKNSGTETLNGSLKLKQLYLYNGTSIQGTLRLDGSNLNIFSYGDLILESADGNVFLGRDSDASTIEMGMHLKIDVSDDGYTYVQQAGESIFELSNNGMNILKNLYFENSYNHIKGTQDRLELYARNEFLFNKSLYVGSVSSNNRLTTKAELDGAVSSTYKAKGSKGKNFLVAGNLIAENLGNVYNINEPFETSNLFREGPDLEFEAGTNVAIVEKDGGGYEFDVLAGFVDLSEYLVKNISQGSGISIYNNGSGTFTIINSSPNANHTGDVTGSRELTITAGAVTENKIADGAVTLSKLTQEIGDTLSAADTVYSWYLANAQSLASEYYVDEQISTHTHGQLSNDGKLTDNQTKAPGFKFVMTDGSNLMKQVNIALTSGTTKYLREDGSWGTPTNTTYTFATGDSNGQFKVTPSGGSAQNVSIKGLGSAAYTSSGAYAPAGHNHDSVYLKLDGGTMVGPINMGNWNITNLDSPQDPFDAVNKVYVDESILWTVVS